MDYEPAIKKNKSFTLVEVLVGTFLILTVFLGIFAAYQLGLKVVGSSKNKIVAIAISNQEIEKVRNLSYQSVGVAGSFPDGILEASSEVTRNNVKYTIERRVDYATDSTDGIAPPADQCPNDYKKIEIKVSWPGILGGVVKANTNLSPKNLAQECAESGGILSISVFDAYGIMVPSPLIEVKNPTTDQTLKTATPPAGKYYFSLAASTYKIVISKSGYSTERTYGTEEIATPEKPHLIVFNGQLTEASFSIDEVSSFSVDTFSPWGTDSFSDSFSDSSKISESSNIEVSGNEVNLSKTDGEYESSGFLLSITISPENFTDWDEFSFTDNEPVGTQILYQVFYLEEENWVLVPDDDLPDNSSGFGTSPVDLSVLSATTYPQLRIKGNLSTTDPAISPTLYDWQVFWITSQATPIPNAAFHLRGTKIIGLDEDDEPVYKYSQDQVSDGSGHKNLSNLEWDSYVFSVNPTSGFDLVGTDPSLQPINLAPDAALAVKLYLDAENSLLVTIQNVETLEPVFSATVRLQNAGLGYDVTQYTNENGQTYFIPLENATFNLEIQAPGYSPFSGQVSVSGDEVQIIKLEQIE